jgi:hypothetical protein
MARKRRALLTEDRRGCTSARRLRTISGPRIEILAWASVHEYTLRNGLNETGEGRCLVWDSFFDALSALLWRPTENRPASAPRIWLLVTIATFLGLTLYLTLR